MSNPFIVIDHLCYAYTEENGQEEKQVIKDLSLTIDRGEYVAILGHNGSGKSTLAKLLNMILEPNAGKLVIDGKDLTDPDIKEEDIIALRKKVGMVFQNPDNQLVATIVEEDVAFGPENLGVPSEQIRTLVDDALATVGMMTSPETRKKVFDGVSNGATKVKNTVVDGFNKVKRKFSKKEEEEDPCNNCSAYGFCRTRCEHFGSKSWKQRHHKES